MKRVIRSRSWFPLMEQLGLFSLKKQQPRQRNDSSNVSSTERSWLSTAYFNARNTGCLMKTGSTLKNKWKEEIFLCKQGSEHLQQGTMDFKCSAMDSHGRELVRCTKHTEGKLGSGDPWAPRGLERGEGLDLPLDIWGLLKRNDTELHRPSGQIQRSHSHVSQVSKTT